jgi:hypothetical protein
VYCGGQCQPDFDDIRFTDDDGYTLLDYWTESVVESDYATFWVEVEDNLDFDTTIYMYFGNSTVSSLSNGTATFMYFDDFENGNFDVWDQVGTDVSFESSIVRDGSFSAELPGGGAERYLAQNISALYNGSFMVHSWVNLDTSSNRAGYPVYWSGITTTEQIHTGYSVFGHYSQWCHASYSIDPVVWSQNEDFVSDTWYRIEVGFDLANSMQRAWSNHLLMGEIPLKPQLVNANVTAIKSLSVASGNDVGEHMWVDNFYIRKWIPLEPTHGSWGEFSTPPQITDVEDFWYEASESGNEIEWTISNFNPISYELFRDGGLLTSDTWPGEPMISFDIENLSPGEYNYTIVVYGDTGTVVSDTAIVTVVDLTSPSLGHPADAVYEYGTTGHAIVWSVSDLYPGEYAVTRDASLIEADSWTAGTIIIDTDGLDLGEYSYLIGVMDSSGNFVQDTVTITVVDTTAPILNHPSNILGYIGDTSIKVTWQPTDLLPFNYEIYQNHTLITSGSWTSGGNLTYTLEDVTLGSYNITIVVWDPSGNYAIDTVFISIDEETAQPLGDVLVVAISVGSLGVIVVIVGLICRNKNSTQLSTPDSYGW